MLRCYALTDQQWEQIAPFLPPEKNGKRKRPLKINRIMLNTMIWIARSGPPWRDAPEYHAPWENVYIRFRKWVDDGLPDNIFRLLAMDAGSYEVSLDASIVQAEMELSRGDRNVQAADFGSGNGPFERTAALMGFEEALMSLALGPEATYGLLNAIATEQCLFMSPDAYRKPIKPVHKRIYDAATAYDMIDIGVKAWISAQPTHDIEGILQKYGDRSCIIGGYDTNGLPGRPNAAIETVETEVVRDFETYGKYPSYIFFGFL